MQNQIYSLEELFKLGQFRIPNYQRSYSWEESPQLEDFLSDLRQQVIAQKKSNDKTYFFGTILLHEHAGSVDVVDGQQRLTTSVIFMSAMLEADNRLAFLDEQRRRLLKRYFIFDEDEETQKFRTIDADNNFFRSKILNITEIANQPKESVSSSRLQAAKDYFIEHIDDGEWLDLSVVLSNAQVMSYTVNDYADATQIFELQNDRGKGLTTLESLKSYLMHQVYLHARNPNDKLAGIQEHFAQIFRNYESFKDVNTAPTEDAVLSYHCVAYLSWSGEEWRNPKALVKTIIRGLEEKKIPSWVETFVSNLARSFEIVSELYYKIRNTNQLVAFSHLVVLGRLAPFWPLIIRSYDADDTSSKVHFDKTVRLMENYSFRGYGMSNLRSDAGQSSFYTKAKNFKSIEDIQCHLHSMCSWYDIETRFIHGLDSAKAYKNSRKDLTYFFWRYENYLRSQAGKQQPSLNWKTLAEPESNAKKLSLEHISPQSDDVINTLVSWNENDEPKEFKHVVLHRLGNLVIDSISTNSSKGKKGFIDKLPHFEERSIYLSQGELKDSAKVEDSNEYQWTMEQIKTRQQNLLDFASKMWNPDNYFKAQEHNQVTK